MPNYDSTNKSYRLIALLGIVGLFFTFYSCSEENRTAQRPEGISPLFTPLPISAEDPADNISTPAKIELGHMLFFEPKLSRSGIISCNTCHVVGAAGVDHRERAIGEGAQVGPRNTPTVFNAAFLKAQFWDGRSPTLEDQAKGPIQAHVEMDLTPEEAITRLRDTGYLPYFEAAFPEESNPLTFDNLAKAIASFERTLLTPGSPFDRYLEGDQNALNETELAGLQLFQNTGCVSCHNGPLLGGTLFMKFTHLKTQGISDDEGVYQVSGNPSDQFVFRVAPLRNVAQTYPYFHNGSVDKLEDAVKIMGSAQLGRTFNDDEVEALVAFMNALTGEYPLIAHPALPRQRR